ncbi:hypothetical protein BJY04DRAFT_217137 [Aspergillus karnatakaensis]|uniref:uncharacterized protein n=1 Tax=Aspergillus karnatakaensis TaxID=1810916 RepID=UPI003CCCE7C5
MPRVRHIVFPKDSNAYLLRCRKFLVEFFIKASQGPLSVAESIIGLLTFEILDLTHTCCEAYWCWPDVSFQYVQRIYIDDFDQEEADEIHDEEREYIQEFEILLEELLVKHDELGLPLWDYIQEYWCDRMKE